MAIIIPPVPPVPKDLNPALSRFLTSIKTIMETREGTRASGLHKFLTLEDVSDLDLTYNVTVRQIVTGTIFDASSIDPPTGFTVSKETYYHYLQWTNPTDERLSHTEVWWNTSNDLSTADLMVIVTQPQNYYRNLRVVDHLDRYYWIRARTLGGGYSTWVPTDAYGDPEGYMVAKDPTVGTIIDKIMAELRAMPSPSLPADSFYKIGQISGSWTIGFNANLVCDGTLLARHIAADQITATHVGANQIITQSANIGAAVITEAQIATAAITSVKIATAAITEAKLGSLSVTNAKIGNSAVTNAKIANLAVDNAKIADLHAAKITAGTITTDKLIGAAVTTSGSSFTASQKPPDYGTATVGSVTFTTIGGPVVVLARLKSITSETYATCTARLVFDGTVLISETQEIADDYDGEFMAVYRHTPAAGSHTWQLQLISTSSNDMYATNAGLVVMELKR